MSTNSPRLLLGVDTLPPCKRVADRLDQPLVIIAPRLQALQQFRLGRLIHVEHFPPPNPTCTVLPLSADAQQVGHLPRLAIQCLPHLMSLVGGGRSKVEATFHGLDARGHDVLAGEG